MFEHGVKDGEQLAHRRSPGDLARFTRGKQAIIEGGDDRVFVSRDHGRHIERGAHTGASAPDGPPSAHHSAVAVERS
jgi:hypothetical protein